MKSRFLLSAAAALFAASFAAVAANAPAEPTEKAPVVKKKVKPHSHAEANKQGTAPPEKSAPAGEAKKPLHDHMKEHKP